VIAIYIFLYLGLSPFKIFIFYHLNFNYYQILLQNDKKMNSVTIFKT